MGPLRLFGSSLAHAGRIARPGALLAATLSASG